MPHGHHIYAKASDMAKATVCAYLQSYHISPHWKRVMRCCDKFPSVNLPPQETDDQYSNTSSPISFHVYYLISRCKTYLRIPLNDKKICCKFKQDSVSEQSTKKYTKKEPVTTETKIYNYHTSFYIPEIHKLAFHIPYVQILGTNHCGESRLTVFKRHKPFQDVLCCREYTETLVASFSYQIQS